MRRQSGRMAGAFWLQLAFQTAAVVTATAAAAAVERTVGADASAHHFIINDLDADGFLFSGSSGPDYASLDSAPSAAPFLEEFATAPPVLMPEPAFDFLAGLDALTTPSSDWLYLE